jgi:periplasmic protein TonB
MTKKSLLTSTLVLFVCALLMGQTNNVHTVENADLPVLNIVDSPPEYVGGESALYSFIYQRLKFPNDSDMKECTVYVSFIVNENGSLSNIYVARGFSRDYNEEAIRVVSALPKWKAGKHEGKFRKVFWTLPVRFKLGTASY